MSRPIRLHPDDDACRATLSKAFTRKPEGLRILEACLPLKIQLRVRSAFLRVPSFTNIGDGASRDSRHLPASAVSDLLALYEKVRGDSVVRGLSGANTSPRLAHRIEVMLVATSAASSGLKISTPSRRKGAL